MVSIRSMMFCACCWLRSVFAQCFSNKSRCRRACSAAIFTCRFIARSVFFRALRCPARRPCWLIAIDSWFIRFKNPFGSFIRAFRPRLRISIVAFISVRVASRNKTQSVG